MEMCKAKFRNRIRMSTEITMDMSLKFTFVPFFFSVTHIFVPHVQTLPDPTRSAFFEQTNISFEYVRAIISVQNLKRIGFIPCMY